MRRGIAAQLDCVIGALLAAGLLALGTGPAKAERLITSLSNHQVLVSSSFTGFDLVLFGAIERDGATVARRGGYDIVVTVTGPRQTLVVRRKDRVLGIWSNAESRSFLRAPTYMAVLSNRPVDDIASIDVQRRMEIGTFVIPRPHVAAGIQSGEDTFRDALMRLRQNRRLYVDDPNGVTFLTPNLFRATISLPAEAPVGPYEVDVRLFADGAHLAQASSALEVVKVGVEQFIASSARNHGILYGLATALMALATGWFASVIFRRD
jgi:uncharacterized protein (TIGR02186 family)